MSHSFAALEALRVIEQENIRKHKSGTTSLINIAQKPDHEVEDILQARYGDVIATWIMARMPANDSSHTVRHTHQSAR